MVSFHHLKSTAAKRKAKVEPGSQFVSPLIPLNFTITTDPEVGDFERADQTFQRVSTLLH